MLAPVCDPDGIWESLDPSSPCSEDQHCPPGWLGPHFASLTPAGNAPLCLNPWQNSWKTWESRLSSPWEGDVVQGNTPGPRDEQGWEWSPRVPAQVRGLLIPQESALALVPINNAIIDSPCRKQPVHVRCEGDTSWGEAPNPLQVTQSPPGSLCDNKKGFEGGQEDSVQPHICWKEQWGFGEEQSEEEEKGGKVTQGAALPHCWEFVKWLLLVQRHQGKPC